MAFEFDPADMTGTTVPPSDEPPTAPATGPVAFTPEFPFSPSVDASDTPPFRQDADDEFVHQTLKEIHFEEGGITRAGNKFVNWLLGRKLWASEVRDIPGGLSGVIEHYATPTQRGEGLLPADTHILDLTVPDDRRAFAEWLKHSWRYIPEFKEIVRGIVEWYDPESDSFKISDTAPPEHDLPVVGGDVAAAVPEIAAALEEAPVDPTIDGELINSLMAEFDDLMPDDLMADHESIITEAFQASASRYTTRLAQDAQWIVVTGIPEDAIPGVTNVAFVLSFDGTPFGDINSVFDLFSNGEIGPPRTDIFLEDLLRDDPDKFRQIQQELFALGYMDRFMAQGQRPIWGEMSVMESDMTVAALADLQTDILAESMLAQRQGEELDPNKIRNQLVVSRGREGEDLASTDTRVRSEVAEEIGGRALQIIEDFGHAITPKGQAEIVVRVNDMINEFTPQEAEQMFGEGGSDREVALTNAVLSEFYGTPDWGEAVTFGPHDVGQSALNYARRVGAVSDAEYDQLLGGTLTPDHYGRQLRDPGIRRDIATANFLKFLNAGGSRRENMDLADSVTNEELEDALITYANTLGLSHSTAGDSADYARMVRRARASLPSLEEAREPLREMGRSVVEGMGIERAAPTAVLDAISRGMPSVTRVPRSRVPNV